MTSHPDIASYLLIGQKEHSRVVVEVRTRFFQKFAVDQSLILARPSE